MEIYNETIRDLLNPAQTSLKIHESLTRGVFVGNLSEEPVSCLQEAWNCIQRGEEQRHVGETNFNDTSSRSHALVRLVWMLHFAECLWTGMVDLEGHLVD